MFESSRFYLFWQLLFWKCKLKCQCPTRLFRFKALKNLKQMVTKKPQFVSWRWKWKIHTNFLKYITEIKAIQCFLIKTNTFLNTYSTEEENNRLYATSFIISPNISDPVPSSINELIDTACPTAWSISGKRDRNWIGKCQ